MSKITALRSGRGQGKRVNVCLDGKFAFSLGSEVVVREKLQVEQELSPEQIEELAKADRFYRCLDVAARYLTYRPRSESELKEKLGKRGFDTITQDAVIDKLKKQGLGGDTAFAQFWKDNRESFSPRSRRLTTLELKRKGVANEVIDQVVSTIDDDNSAYQAALTRLPRLRRYEYRDFQRRLSEFLRRRGFDYDVVNNIVERLWREKGEQTG